nr:hypothetical protein L203_05680 [Cryptococcus depauperatus CBS 7841]ODN85486.1 hypothetical protein L203_04735 [Cryptococcus depauperatus CBS 7841]
MSNLPSSNDGFNSSQLDATPQSVVETSHASDSRLEESLAEIAKGYIHYRTSWHTFKRVNPNSGLRESQRYMTNLEREVKGDEHGNVNLDKVISLSGELRTELGTVIGNGKLSKADRYLLTRVTESLPTGEEHFTRAKSLLAESQGDQGDNSLSGL